MFLLTYFRTGAESLHYALSEDGLTWRALNDNRPVLRSTIGSRYESMTQKPGTAFLPVVTARANSLCR